MAQESESKEVESFSKGLEVIVLSAGDGKTYPKKNDLVVVTYKGTFHGGAKHEQEFDVCLDDKSPYKFKVGDEIKGWNKGIKQMSLGERSLLKIPHRLAYGVDGNADYGIPQSQDLLYEIHLLDIIAKLTSGVDVQIIKSNNDEQAKHPQKGDKIMISYVGTFHGGDNHGKIFENTNGKCTQFTIGLGQLIKGWDHGIPQMKYGETALLKISSDFAYGKKGARGRPPIPPNQDLQFKVHLMEKQ
eukprot:145968_1